MTAPRAIRHSSISPATLSRRTLLQSLGAFGAFGALGALGGCGTPTQTAGGPSVGASTADASFPIEVTHRFGVATIEAAPTRVVCLGYTDADYALALGTVPTGVTQWIPQWKRGVGSWAVDKLGGVTPALFTPPWDFEKIASLTPDVIFNISSDGNEADWKKLNAIAPTVAPPAGFGAYGTPWTETAVMIGTALGRKSDAELLVGNTQASITKAAADNPSFAGKTISIITHYNGGTIGCYHTSDTRMRLLAGLGLKANDYVQGLGEKDFFSDVSAEQIDRLDADVVIAFGDPGQTVKDLYSSIPGLQTLSATKRGAMIAISDLEPAMAFSASTVLSIPLALETVVPPLQKATA
jgi:iron complex transport system substrate-binding protein